MKGSSKNRVSAAPRNLTQDLLQVGMELEDEHSGLVVEMMRRNPELGMFITPDFSAQQAAVVLDGLGRGLDVTRYADADYDWLQMKTIMEWLEKGLDITPWVDSSIDAKVMQQVGLALKNGISDKKISMIADPRWNGLQAQEIRLGIQNGVDVGKYANPRYNHHQMRRIREYLENES